MGCPIVPVRYKPKAKRRVVEEAREEMQGMASRKRMKVGDIPDGDAAEPVAAGGDDWGQQKEAARGEGDRPELGQKAAPVPLRVEAKSKQNKQTPSRGKGTEVDPRQRPI